MARTSSSHLGEWVFFMYVGGGVGWEVGLMKVSLIKCSYFDSSLVIFSQADKDKLPISSEEEIAKDPDSTTKGVPKCDDPTTDLFEQNFKELRKWVDVKPSKFGLLLVLRERRCGRLGTALKVKIHTQY